MCATASISTRAPDGRPATSTVARAGGQSPYGQRTSLPCEPLAPSLPAGLGERDAERLEDGLEHVLGVVAVEQPDVHRQPGALCELAQEASDEVRLQTADPCGGEVDVR